MTNVVSHPSLAAGVVRKAAPDIERLTDAVESIVVTLFQSRFSHLPSVAIDGAMAMACVQIAAKASGRASLAVNSPDLLDDWRCCAMLGDAVLSDVLSRAGAASA